MSEKTTEKYFCSICGDGFKERSPAVYHMIDEHDYTFDDADNCNFRENKAKQDLDDLLWTIAFKEDSK